MAREWTVVKALTPLLRRHAVMVGVLVALGVVVALSEGIGLGLFMPLLGGLEGASPAALAGGRLEAIVAAPFAGLAPPLRLRAVLLCLFFLLAVRNVTVLAHGTLLARLTSRLAHELRSAAVGQVLRGEERWLARRDTGAWLNLLESQTWETAAAVGALAGIATRLCKIGVFATALVCISWRLTLLVAVALRLVSLGVRLLARRVDGLGRAEKEAWEVLAQRLVETLRTLRTIRVFGREEFEQARFDACSDVERRTFQRLQVLQALVPPASEFLVATIMLVVLWSALATPGELPAVLAFLALLYRLHPQVQQLDAARVSLVAAFAPAAAVMELLAPGDEPVLRSGARRCERLETGITLREVTFRYEAGGPPALDRVSLHIPAGATTAIAGPSGAGKSTLCASSCASRIRRAVRSRSTARRSRSSTRPRGARGSPSSARTFRSSTPPWPRTSPTGGRPPPATRRFARRHGVRTRTASSRPCHMATPRASAPTARGSPVGSGSGSRSPARCCAIPRS
jgi:subfamily B ATP-binding cassette protein MsbA